MRRLVLGLTLALVAALGPQAGGKAMAKGAAWERVDKLVDEQKLSEAADATRTILTSARDKADEAEWTRALVRLVQLRIALDGYETAVRLLKDEPWPKGRLHRVTLDLFYAHAIVSYMQAYQWEIRRREAVAAKGPVDLKAWTLDQLYREALGAYDAAWQQRAELGDQPESLLADYLTPGTYPPGIRSTLRDAISYFAVDLLANSSFWRPEQANDVYRLGVRTLLAGAGGAPKGFKLDDEALHPLQRLAGVLGDLEDWHSGARRAPAALEARIERSRRVHAALTDEGDRRVVIASLSSKLAEHRDHDWWSMGKAAMARMRRDAGDLVKAHADAKEGRAAYPKSVGGETCLAIQKEIEAPAYQLAGMATDTAKRRSLAVTHKNLPRLYFRAWRVDLDKHLAQSKDYELLPGWQDYQALAKRPHDAAWSLELPATPDFESHRTFVTPVLARQGLYVIAASAREDFAAGDNVAVAVDFVLTDLVILSRRDAAGGLDVSVVGGKDGRPIAGATVELWKLDYGKRHSIAESKKTDADGGVRFATGQGYASHFLIARKDGDVSIDAQAQYSGHQPERSATTASFVYTDRSVYRPGQKLRFKAVAFGGEADKASFKVAAGKALEVALADANGEVVAKRSVTTNAFGSAAGEIEIPAGRLLGQWSLRVAGAPGTVGYAGRAAVRVEEYKRPTFEVALDDPESALRLGREAELKGTARYYFGLPVASGVVKWRVTREPVMPWWWAYWWRGGGIQQERTQTVATGQSAVEADGTFRLRFLPEADERQGKDVSYRYAVTADLTDDGGETRSATRSFRLGFVAVEATIASDAGFLRHGQAARLSVRRTSLDGVPRAGEGRWRLLALKQPETAVPPADLPLPPPPESEAAKPRTPGDGLRERWNHMYTADAELARWADGSERAAGTLAHDAKGEATVALPDLEPGAYRLRYETTDEFGARFETWKDLVVAGRGALPLRVPAILAVESATVKVGGTARLLVHTGLPDQRFFLDVYRDRRLRERRVLQGGGEAVIELPVTEGERGGFSVALTLVADHQLVRLEQSILVPWDSKELTLDFATFRDKIRPGAKERWRVTVKGLAGKAEQAEVLAYMYDRSLDIFSPHVPPSPLAVFPSRTGTSSLQSCLRQAWGQSFLDSSFEPTPAEPSVYGSQLAFFDAYGIGGPGRAHFGMRLQKASRSRAPAEGGGQAKKEYAASAWDDEAAPAAPPAMADAAAAPTGAKAKAAEPQPKPAQEPAQPAGDEGVRRNFDETAFFLPQLVTGEDGAVALEFDAPDSVTSWSVWAHALTKDLRSGSLKRETRSVKELMVRPYLPRFFREGDTAEIKVVVNNAGDAALAGELTLEIQDPETGASLAEAFGVKEGRRSFKAEPGKGADVAFALAVPKRVGVVAFKVTAKAGAFADGELRPLPVLPSRMHLAQSRFVTLRDAEKRTMSFPAMAAADDPTLAHEKLVVSVDAQLLYGVLKALPYLSNYPYECTEQTLNRFLSAGIVASVFRDEPAVAKMAKAFAARDTQLEVWDKDDPNRRMTLEESPWLEESRGGAADAARLVKVLDPAVVRAEQTAALAKLRKAQTAVGGFPWFPGGPPSPYITLYLLHGFARAAEFGVDVPKDMVTRAAIYLGTHFRAEYAARMLKDDCCWEFLTFLNYVAGAFPDESWTRGMLSPAERQQILDHGFKHWRKHSPYLKGYLALTLKRAGRAADARLVFDSVMDSARTDKDQGTYWAAEDRSWLWYNDTIETHAFALRTLMELAPDHPKKDGLVLWLFLNKKLNHWKSTRATAEAIYALVRFLKADKSLGVREEVKVTLGGETRAFAFAPDEYTGKARIEVPGDKVDARTMSEIKVEKTTKGFAFASATWHYATDKLPAEASGDFFGVTRRWFKREHDGKEFVLRPLAEGAALSVGDELEVQLSLTAKHEAEYVHLRDPRAAGLEPEGAVSRYKWDLGIGWYEETRDSGANFFFERLPAGQYTFRYRVRASTAGVFRVGPATVQSMYAPEFAAHSAGDTLKIGK